MDQLLALWATNSLTFVDGQASDPVPVLSDVPPGAVLGPIIFLFFIYDLPSNLSSLRFTCTQTIVPRFIVYSNIHSLQHCLNLQEDIDSLAFWEADLQM